MSTFVPATVACGCGERYRVEIATGLHISARPDLRAAILAGTFHHFRCPRCAAITVADSLIAFTDFARRQFFTVAPSEGWRACTGWRTLAERSFAATMVDQVPLLVARWGREMTRRVVFGVRALREKLVLHDAGLDDHVAELLKLQLVRDVGGPLAAASELWIAEVTADELVLDDARGTRLPRALYDELAAYPPLAGIIATAFPDGLVIDRRALLAA